MKMSSFLYICLVLYMFLGGFWRVLFVCLLHLVIQYAKLAKCNYDIVHLHFFLLLEGTHPTPLPGGSRGNQGDKKLTLYSRRAVPWHRCPLHYQQDFLFIY